MILPWFVAMMFFMANEFSAQQRLTSGNGENKLRRIDSLTQELSRSSNALEDTTRVNILNELAWQLRTTAPAKAVEYGKQAITLAQKIDFKRGLVKSYSYVGVCYRNQAEYGHAAEYYLLQLRLAEELNADDDEFFALTNIGNLYILQDDWAKALEYLLRSMKYAESRGTLQQRSYTYVNIGRAYSGQKQYRKGLDYLEKALAIRQALADTQQIAIALHDVAIANYALGDTAKGLRYHQQTIDFANVSDGHLTARALTFMAKVYHNRNMIDSSDTLAKRALRIALETNQPETITVALRILADNQARRGHFQDAYTMQKEYIALHDSLMDGRGVREIAMLQGRYEIEKKQREIDTLIAYEERQDILRNALIAGVILTVGFVVILVNRNRLKERTNQEILHQKSLVEQKTREAEASNKALEEQNHLIEQERETLALTNTALAEANTVKTELLGIAAHDLKNPIANILLIAELLEASQGNMKPEKFKDYTSGIRESSARMLQLIDQLLGINALEQGKFNITLENVSVDTLLMNEKENFSLTANAKNISLYLDVPEDVNVMADCSGLQQIVDNFVSNAIKYSPKGKNVWIRGETIRYENGKFVRISVRDEGPGLSEKDQQRLFTAFARLTARPTGGENSTGLGLAIVKKIAEAMNGRVGCESRLGEGATFFVEFPHA
ncbi:MAG: tetratricopeptide repeat-containing sensor histidine kinase [Candidatus Kapaibacteriota bacterium]